MTIKEFQPQDKQILIDIIQDNDWPFHAGSKPSDEKIEKRVSEGFYSNNECKTFLIFKKESNPIGFLKIDDLGAEDPYADTPLFDIRIAEKERNNGFGKKVVIWLTKFIFSNYSNTNRIEATTRQDNIAMRKVLEQCGFVKEAHYRRSWPTRNGKIMDTIGYGILREDWKNNSKTPVNWND